MNRLHGDTSELSDLLLVKEQKYLDLYLFLNKKTFICNDKFKLRGRLVDTVHTFLPVSSSKNYTCMLK